MPLPADAAAADNASVIVRSQSNCAPNCHVNLMLPRQRHRLKCHSEGENIKPTSEYGTNRFHRRMKGERYSMPEWTKAANVWSGSWRQFRPLCTCKAQMTCSSVPRAAQGLTG